MYKSLALFIALLATPAAALTQSAPAGAAALTPAQQAQLRKQDAQMGQAALQVAQLVDQGKTAQVWDGASSVARQTVSRDAFVKQVDADRQQVGALQSRKLAGITRTRSSGSAMPAGYYINVSFASRFAHAAKPVRELVSFHLDTDKVWRVAGYTLR